MQLLISKSLYNHKKEIKRANLLILYILLILWYNNCFNKKKSNLGVETMKKVSLVFLLLTFTPAMYLFSTLADTKIEETPNYEQYLNDKIAYQNRDNYLTITQYYQFMEETATNYANIVV